MDLSQSNESLNSAGNKQYANLTDVPINTQTEALQVMVSFLNLAQKRGTFAFDESAKIWECIKMFQQKE